MKKSRRLREASNLYDKTKEYTIKEAVDVLKKVTPAKFDETIEVAVNLGVNPKHADQMVRGSVVLPHGTGKSIRVLVFAKGEKAEEAKKAGADYVGDQELIDKINSGWLEFDAVVADPEMMKEIGKLGRVLGTRGLMPSPKTGTVTKDIEKCVNELKAGKVDFRVNKFGDINLPVAKLSFDSEKVVENIASIIKAIIKAKPLAAKGKYLKKISLSATMSIGMQLDLAEFA